MTYVSVGDVAEVNPKFLPKNRADLAKEISFVPMAEVSDEHGRIENEVYRPLGEVLKGFTPFEDGDILVAKITPCFENGKIAHASISREWGFGSTEFHVLRGNSELVDDRYLFHFVRTPAVRLAGERRMTGSAGQKRVPKAFLEALKLPLLPLPEQKRIAAILDQADALREKRRAAIAKLDELLQSVFLDMFGDPVTNPKGWRIGRIGDLLEDVSYGTSKKASTEGAWPILRMNNITYTGEWDFTDLKYIELSSKEEEKYLVREGEILFNRTNSKELVGKTAVYRAQAPMAFAGYLIRCRTNKNAVPDYISSYLNSRHGKLTLMGMCKSIIGMANINAKELQSIKIMIPPIDVQRKYELIIRKLLVFKQSLEPSTRKLDALFTSLQQRAFRGEL